MVRAYQEEGVAKDNRYPPEIEFSSANKIYVSKETNLRQCIKNAFNNELESVDFKSSPEASRETINEWVAKTTRDQIKNFISEGSLTTETKLVLANAAYFKGQWEFKFDPKITKKEVFYTTQEDYNFVDMMYSKNRYNFGKLIFELL